MGLQFTSSCFCLNVIVHDSKTLDWKVIHVDITQKKEKAPTFEKVLNLCSKVIYSVFIWLICKYLLPISPFMVLNVKTYSMQELEDK